MKNSIKIDYEINPKTLPNFLILKNGSSISLKELSKKDLEQYAEAYKQAVIKKHWVTLPKYC